MLQSHFGRNQHQAIPRKFFSISQSGTVEDYVERFYDLFDQLSAYEEYPNTVHYVMRFMVGLKPPVRIAVGIQQPDDLDSAYQMALLHEELGATQNVSSSIPASRRSSALPLPLPPTPFPPVRLPEDKRYADNGRKSDPDEKWGALRAYHKAKGLCFTCGECWGHGH